MENGNSRLTSQPFNQRPNPFIRKQMKKIILLIVLLVRFTNPAVSQGYNSFYLDSAYKGGRAQFTDSAIYFFTLDHLIKTDYSGQLIWSKQFPSGIHKIVVKEEYIFGISGTKAFRLDTSGNTIWVRDFSMKVVPASNDSNVLDDLAFDGSRLYIQEMQGNSIVWGHPFYPAVLVLDTGGNILNSTYQVITPGGNFEEGIAASSIQQGAMFSYIYYSGVSGYSYIALIDTNGSYAFPNSPSFFNGIYNYIQNIIPTYDSSYLVITNSWEQNTSGYLGSFNCTKLDRYGNLIWGYNYYDPIFPGTQYTAAYGITSDSLNNVYIVGGVTKQPDGGNFFMKLDASGNVLFTKLDMHGNPKMNFHDPNVSYYGVNRLHYLNGKIYALFNYNPSGNNYYPTIITFDTSFFNPCFIPDTITHLQNIIPLNSAGSITSPTAITYLPATDTITANLRVISSTKDVCLVTGQNFSPDIVLDLQISPIPVRNFLKLQTRQRIDQINLFNLLGEKVMAVNLQTANCKQPIEIDCSLLPSGIYILQASGDGKMWRGKVVKE
jgi:hypothetical protein